MSMMSKLFAAIQASNSAWTVAVTRSLPGGTFLSPVVFISSSAAKIRQRFIKVAPTPLGTAALLMAINFCALW